jgi:GH24 family phage-related lysozyme (muramidase)
MSIFRNTLQPSVQAQLNARQKALSSRTSDSIIHANTRNSWVRMTSAVDVDSDSGKLAHQYILKGGILGPKLDGKYIIKAGVGDDQYSAYNYESPRGISYNSPNVRAGAAGLKPMPGITSIDIKSKSAYGSLREVTVNFVCHNLQQLEDLELLYMRPGYTALIEWGWAPYLNKDGKIETNIEFYDGVLNGGKEKDKVFLELYQLSVKKEHNYDAMYGYVKNYNWTARMDGGYNCQTTIISIGEIMESLKAGYIPFNVNGVIKQKGLLGLVPANATLFTPGVTNLYLEAYSKNILAGLCKEIYDYCAGVGISDFPKLPKQNTSGNYVSSIQYYDYDLFKFDYKTTEIPNSLASSGKQVYITLESFVQLLNDYVLLYAGKDAKTAKPFITISTNSNTYETGSASPLLCLAHPLQVSVDPTICLITNDIWAKGVDFTGINDGTENGTPGLYDAQALDIYNQLKAAGVFTDENPIGKKLLEYIGYGKPDYNVNNAKEFVRSFAKVWRQKNPNVVINVAGEIRVLLDKLTNNVDVDTNDPTYQTLFSIDTINANDAEEKDANVVATKIAAGGNPFGVEYLATLAKGNIPFENKNETGFIGNIYLNIDFLYRLSVEPGLLDPKTQELKLFDYLRNVLKNVQESIGGVNNFEIHVDPIDSVARIIDLNYVDAIPKIEAYSRAYQIEMHNLSGSVRSYELQSQIFPEQGAMIAIGAQVKATSAQGTAASSLLDFNNNLYDRILGRKYDSPLSNQFAFSNNDNGNEKFENLKTNLNIIRTFLFEQPTILDNDQSVNNQEKASEYKSALRDIIVYFQETVKSNTTGRAIIPVKISLTMDGIGGLVIGHLFKIPKDLLPRGYGSDNVGGKLIQTITSIGHKVENGDWTTTIDALNIVTTSPSGLDKTFNDLLTETKTGFKVSTPLGFQNLTGPWTERAFQIITRFEGFEPVAKYDINHYRGGYGSDKKLVNGVLENVTLNTTFTKEEAKATLIYELSNSYGPRVVRQIGINVWGKLTSNQQAALVSYAYNAGAGALNNWGITKNLQDGRHDLAAQNIKRGPTTAGGVVLAGLVSRREQESILFTTA